MISTRFRETITRHPIAEKQNLKYLLAFLYTPAILISLIEIFTDLVYTVIQEPGPGYVYTPVLDSPVYQVQSVLFVLLMVFALYIGFSSWLKQKPGRARQRNFLVSIGIVIIVLSGAMSAFTFPLLGIHIPNTVFFGIVCFSGIGHCGRLPCQYLRPGRLPPAIVWLMTQINHPSFHHRHWASSPMGCIGQPWQRSTFSANR